jgi:nicotinate dehydrogenase subunit B
MKTAAMTPGAQAALSRRNFLKSAGVLIVGFRMAGGDAAQAQFGQAPLPGAPPMDQVDSWLAIAADGSITAYSGKEELGQGISTAQQQLVAEELSVPFDRVKLIYCDTALTPDQAYTSGSQSHPANFNHANLAQACATARETLFKLAAQRLQVPVDKLVAFDGHIAPMRDSMTLISYAQLIAGKKLNLTIDKAAKRKNPRQWTVLGKPIGRPDMPLMATGRFEYVHNRAPAWDAARPRGASARGRRHAHQRRRKLRQEYAGRGQSRHAQEFCGRSGGEALAGNPGGREVEGLVDPRHRPAQTVGIL